MRGDEIQYEVLAFYCAIVIGIAIFVFLFPGVIVDYNDPSSVCAREGLEHISKSEGSGLPIIDVINDTESFCADMCDFRTEDLEFAMIDKKGCYVGKLQCACS